MTRGGGAVDVSGFETGTSTAEPLPVVTSKEISVNQPSAGTSKAKPLLDGNIRKTCFNDMEKDTPPVGEVVFEVLNAEQDDIFHIPYSELLN